MTIQIAQIIKSYTKMSDNERLDLVKRMRHNKYVLKPALVVKKKKAAAKKARPKARKVVSLISKMTNAQKLLLLQELENE